MPEVDAREIEIRERWDAGDRSGATTAVLRGYGPEIFGLLLRLHRDEQDADDAFSFFSERLWASFDRFQWQCSVRTWAYLLARNASHDVHRADAHRPRRRPLSACPEVDAMAADVRTRTVTFLRTETRTEIQKLAETLPAEDRTLLILRVDRDLPWNDVARIFLGSSGADDSVSAEALKREAARLRKRLQLVKERLVTLARERGLLTAR